LLAIRAVHVVQGVTCVLTARAAYRKPRLAIAATLASAVEFGWLVRRDVARGRHDSVAARVDAGFAVAGLFALGTATEAADRTSSLNWMMPLTVGGCLGSAAALSQSEGAGISVALGSVYAWSTRDALASRSGRAATALANTTSYPAFFLVAEFVCRTVRHLASELDQARQAAIEERSKAAAEEARNREHRALHDSALQTLEAIASGFEIPVDELRRQARREAIVIRRAISGPLERPGTLRARLDALAVEFEGRGLSVELVLDDIRPEPQAECAEALCEASREALTNVVKHAEVESVVLRAASIDAGTKVVIRDLGAGFHPSPTVHGFGIPHSIVDRISAAGGRATVTSTPGRGTRVELWIPN
jgi:signal transduction histidine kinase